MRVTKRSAIKFIKWLALALVLCAVAVTLSFILLVGHFASQTKHSRSDFKKSVTDPKEMKAAVVPEDTQRPEPSVSRGVTERAAAGDQTLSEQTRPSSFGLSGFAYLLNDPVTTIELCSLDCRGLELAFERLHRYSKGDFAIDEDLRSDPALQLAKAFNQAAFGPTGKELFELFYELQKEPYTWKSLGLAKFVLHLDDLTHEFKERGKTRAIEADEFTARLRHTAKSCETDAWNVECREIERDLADWIGDGALQ